MRQEAIGLADHWRENPEFYNQVSRRVVCKPGAAPGAYRLALLQAEQAIRLAPGNGLYVNTLGVAQFRLGQYQQALETLSRSDKLNLIQFGGSHPADLAFMAMAYHQLGQKKQTQETFARLRETMKWPLWADNQEAQAFLREAEGLLQSPAAKPLK